MLSPEARQCSQIEPAQFISQAIKTFTSNSPANRLPGTKDPIFEEPLVRFASGAVKILEPFSEMVNNRFENWLSQQIKIGKKFTSEQIEWLTKMFTLVQITPPPYNQRVKIAQEASEWITSRVRSTYPGVVDTIKFLNSKNIKICTSSGEVSWELRGYLKGMGVLDCFHKLFGPDIINRMKASSSYYERILENIQLHPSDAITVDDSAHFLSMASELGITTIHVDNHKNCNNKSCHYHISSLSDIKRIIL